jgi:hypothetical protein
MSQEDVTESVAECDDDDSKLPQEQVEVQAHQFSARCPITGKFLPGNRTGGRPKGSKDKLNTMVINTLEDLWKQRGEDMLDQLVAEKPEVVMAMISRMIPQALAAEAITGIDSTENTQGNQEVRITLVNQAADTTAITHNDIPKLVEGEVIPADTTH